MRAAWGVVALGEVAAFSSGGTPDKSREEYYGGETPWISSADIVDGAISAPRTYVSGLGLARSAASVADAGTVLLVTRTGIGKVAVAPYPLSFSQDITAVVPDGEVLDTTYLARFLSFQQQWLVDRARGATIKGVTRDVVASMRIPLPPLDEQRRIARVLDRVDDFRTKRRTAIARSKALLSSLFHDMFGDVGRVGHTSIGEVTHVGTGRTPDRTRDDYFGGDVAWVKTTEVTGGVITSTEETLTHEGVRAAGCAIFPTGSIVIAMYGQGRTRGRCAMLDIEAATNQACAVLMPDARYDSRFMFEQLKLSYDRLRDRARGGNQPNLNLGLIRAFRVVLPDLSEQRRFSRTAGKVDQLITWQRSHLGDLNALFASLEHRAFTGAL